MQRTESKGGKPEYEKQGADTELNKLPPKPELTPSRLEQLFSKLDFSGIEEWPEDVQQQVVELFKEYHHIFALTDLELGCKSKIKHEIKLYNGKHHLKIITVVSLPINLRSRNIYKTCWT